MFLYHWVVSQMPGLWLIITSFQIKIAGVLNKILSPLWVVCSHQLLSTTKAKWPQLILSRWGLGTLFDSLMWPSAHWTYILLIGLSSSSDNSERGGFAFPRSSTAIWFCDTMILLCYYEIVILEGHLPLRTGYLQNQKSKWWWWTFYLNYILELTPSQFNVL